MHPPHATMRATRKRLRRDVTVVFVAGYGNSGSDHWQRRWHVAMPGSVWIEQVAWESPECVAWVQALEQQTRDVRRPIVVVAHSLGCLTVATWAASGEGARQVSGALLVAPPDPMAPSFPPAIRGFAAPEPVRLGFATTVVASSNDPYAELDWTRRTAATWGAELIEVGPRGHLNASSGLGDWPEGRALLAGLTRAAERD